MSGSKSFLPAFIALLSLLVLIQPGDAWHCCKACSDKYCQGPVVYYNNTDRTGMGCSECAAFAKTVCGSVAYQLCFYYDSELGASQKPIGDGAKGVHRMLLEEPETAAPRRELMSGDRDRSGGDGDHSDGDRDHSPPFSCPGKTCCPGGGGGNNCGKPTCLSDTTTCTQLVIQAKA